MNLWVNLLQVGGELRDSGGGVYPQKHPLLPLPGLLRDQRHTARQRSQLWEGRDRGGGSRTDMSFKSLFKLLQGFPDLLHLFLFGSISRRDDLFLEN